MSRVSELVIVTDDYHPAERRLMAQRRYPHTFRHRVLSAATLIAPLILLCALYYVALVFFAVSLF